MWRSGILCRNCSCRPRVQRKSVGQLTRRCDKKSPTVLIIPVEICQLAKFHLQNERKRILKTSNILSGDDSTSGGIQAPLPHVSVRAAHQPLHAALFPRPRASNSSSPRSSLQVRQRFCLPRRAAQPPLRAPIRPFIPSH